MLELEEYNNELLQALKNTVRENLNKYTRRAFGVLPDAEFSRILDIGCGTGVPTIELAKLSIGKIIAIDNDRSQLDILIKKLKVQKLEDRIETLCCSINDMEFEDESFDIIWSEGSIYAVGFERGLEQWRSLLKPIGYMGIHDEKGNVEKKLKVISDCGFKLLDHFILDRDIWWNEYYSPFEKELHKLRNTYLKSADNSAEFRKDLQEIDFFKKHPDRCESVFFIIKNQSGS